MKEREYCTKRASELTAEMEIAISEADMERFDRSYKTAMRYMRVRELRVYYKRFLAAMIQAKRV